MEGKPLIGLSILFWSLPPAGSFFLDRCDMLMVASLDKSTHGFRKAEDAGLLAQVKDDNAAKGVPERPAGMRALVKRRYDRL